MRHRIAKNGPGFTLVEMLVALVVVGIVTIAMVDIFRAQHQAQSRQNTGVERTMNARAALDMMAREMRNAGYDPRKNAGAGFVTTEPSEVEWTADLNADGDTDDSSDFGDEHVRYYFDADAGEILREVGGVEGVVADNITGLTLTYMDGDLNVTADAGEVKQVNIALTYDTPNDVMVGELETQVAIRNQSFACSTEPTVLVDGDFEISGNPDLLGCGKSIHTNGDLKIGGTVVVSGTVSATGTVDLSGALQNESGDDVVPTEGADSQSVPQYENPIVSHCDDADYTLTSTGKVVDESTGTEYDATGSEQFGWKRSGTSPTIWEYSGDAENPGTFCVDGNVKMSGSPGEGEASPTSMSIIAKGSIEVSGNPYLKADDPNGFLFLSGGDLKLNGNSMGALTNYDGTLYALSQCDVSGEVKLSSQLMCKDNPTPGHAVNHVDENKISGDMQITYGCAGDC